MLYLRDREHLSGRLRTATNAALHQAAEFCAHILHSLPAYLPELPTLTSNPAAQAAYFLSSFATNFGRIIDIDEQLWPKHWSRS
jgi:hypothetical protein